jgi:hypothetical protein
MQQHCFQVFFIKDIREPAWRVVLKKEPRNRRVVADVDDQALGIGVQYAGLQAPMNLNAQNFHPELGDDGDVVPAAEVERLNALMRGVRRGGAVGRRAGQGRARRRGRRG